MEEGSERPNDEKEGDDKDNIRESKINIYVEESEHPNISEEKPEERAEEKAEDKVETKFEEKVEEKAEEKVEEKVEENRIRFPLIFCRN